MKIVPYDRFTLVTAKSPDDVAAALAPHVRAPKLIRLNFGAFGKKAEERFEGKADREGFKLWPAIRYRNSFLPIIVGRYEPHVSGTKVEVTQRPHAAVLVFLLVWLGLAGFIFHDMANAAPATRDALPFDPAHLGGRVFAFVYLMALGGFWWEARHTSAALSNILEARRDDGF